MNEPQRIQLSRRKGWRMPANTVKVDRSTRWGNPFVIGVHGTRAECVNLFRYLCAGYLCLTNGNGDAQKAFMAYAKRNRWRLRGKNLACWCPLNAPCHADVLLEVAKNA
jgi:hypothetical protein